MGLVMASMGINPADHEFSEYETAIERVREAARAGQIRAFTGNEYAADLAAGNIAACMAWSGDIIQLQFDNPDLQFVIPAEGATLWSDNMLIPAGARNKRNAEAFMDFVYRPEIAAQIAEWVNFITPIQGAQEAMEEIDPELAEDELIFPSEETLRQTFEFKVLDEEEERQYQDLFQEVIGA
jgi:spermidine/putrescine transport system substrate-binding protein